MSSIPDPGPATSSVSSPLSFTALAPPSQLLTSNSRFSYDIDQHLNPFLPPSFLHKLPKPISHLLGYRESPQPPIPPPLTWLWAFIGAFCGISLVSALYNCISGVNGAKVPIILASFGASAILEYNAITSPLSQPRNLILGQFLSALIGVSICKLFAQLPRERFEDLRWLAGSLAVGVSSMVMGVTKTVHPPAGATALLACTEDTVGELGWWLLPLDLLGSVAILFTALIINNIQRQFPLWWWTDLPISSSSQRDRMEEHKDLEKGKENSEIDGFTRHVEYGGPEVVICEGSIKVPIDLELSHEELALLEALRIKLIGEGTGNAGPRAG